MAPLSPLPPFQVPLPLPLLLPLSPVPVRDRLPANVLVVLCSCRSVGNKLSPTRAVIVPFSETQSSSSSRRVGDGVPRSGGTPRWSPS
jgi:hypothetical protein